MPLWTRGRPAALVDRSGPAGPCRDCPDELGAKEDLAMTTSAGLAGRLDAAWAALAAQRGRVEAGAPWPLSERFDTTPEAYWYPPEVLGHVAEFVDRWAGVVDGCLAAPAGAPFEFGSSPSRLEGIDRFRRLPLAELYGLIEARVTAFRIRLAGLGDADLAVVGRHQVKGETTVGALIEESILGHMEGHARQIEELLAAAGR